MIYQVIDFHNNSIQSSEKLNDINIENNIIFFTESDLIIDLDNIDNNIIMNDLYIYLKTKYEKLQLLIINSIYIDLQLFENCELNQIEYNCSNINKIYIISNSDFNKIKITDNNLQNELDVINNPYVEIKEDEINFESVDSIVMSHLKTIESTTMNNDVLIQIYQSI